LVRQQDELRKERLRKGAVSSFEQLSAAEDFTPIVEAEVIGGDSSKLRESVVIDRGSAHGLAAGMPVVWGQALIGKLTAVGPWASRVQLLTDPQFKVSCYLDKCRAHGLAEGVSKDDLTMSYIGGKVKVTPGEMVLSSGEGGIFPKGLIVGQVTEVEPAGLFQVVHLRPWAELDRLEMVLVLVRKKRSVELGSQPK
jgi:rod shape-determining protein MreC